ncbi:hypothetical protein DPMN_156207 [Dreissena polymorpha]|uniref:Uncharacterized protein n=1 Tax=Dreissena polymorpha TaxID=45954 RepID=A0A9D4FRV7_DREPO|nr:hypothetical protein DPMN_156207 [Dreissena polymorpha]
MGPMQGALLEKVLGNDVIATCHENLFKIMMKNESSVQLPPSDTLILNRTIQ